MENELEAIKKGKESVFVIDNSFDYRKWREVRERIKALELEKDEEIRTQEFIDLFKEIYTGPNQTDKEGGLPPIAFINAFEESMLYLMNKVDDSYKRELVELQLAMLSNKKLPEAVRETIGGIWAYYVDKRHDSPGQEFSAAIHGELKDTLRKVNTKDSRELKLISLADGGLKSYDDPEIEAMRYFADLYARDIGPMEPELSGVLEHEVRRDARMGGEYEPTGEKMSPHERFYTFDNDRLPTQASINNGRVRFVITLEQDIEADRTQPVDKQLFDVLPPVLLDLYLETCWDLRADTDYRGLTPEMRKEERTKTVRQFTRDLIMRKLDDFLKREGTAEDVERVEKIVAKYIDKIESNPTIGAIIDFNKDL